MQIPNEWRTTKERGLHARHDCEINDEKTESFSLSYLFEVDSDGDVVELGPVLEGGRLPPRLLAVDGRTDRVRLVRVRSVAHPALVPPRVHAVHLEHFRYHSTV